MAASKRASVSRTEARASNNRSASATTRATRENTSAGVSMVSPR